MFRPMLLYIFPIALLLVSTVNGYDCPSQLQSGCWCGKTFNDYTNVACRVGEAEVKAVKSESKEKEESEISVYCIEGFRSENELDKKPLNELLPAVELGGENPIFNFDLACPLDEITVQNYLDRLGITGVETLHLFGKQNFKITKEIFAGATSIVHLNVYRNDVEGLPIGVFDHLTNLSIINLSENWFQSLPDNLFSNNKNLTQFIFHENRQDLTLPNGLLSSLPLLEIVDFRFSHISNVPADLFTGSGNVKSISLAANQLTTIPENLFYSQIRLEEVHLDENQLKDVPENLFKNNVELKVVNLESNKLTALPEKLFENNPKLRKIQVGVNEIETIPDNLFSSLVDLEELELRMNRIQRLTAAMLPANIKSLNLYENQLTVIDSAFLKRFDRGLYVHFDFRQNPIHCECNDDLFQLEAVSSKLKGWFFYACGNVREGIQDVIDRCKRLQQS